MTEWHSAIRDLILENKGYYASKLQNECPAKYFNNNLYH
jgi:hypothetical protein